MYIMLGLSLDWRLCLADKLEPIIFEVTVLERDMASITIGHLVRGGRKGLVQLSSGPGQLWNPFICRSKQWIVQLFKFIEQLNNFVLEWSSQFQELLWIATFYYYHKIKKQTHTKTHKLQHHSNFWGFPQQLLLAAAMTTNPQHPGGTGISFN